MSDEIQAPDFKGMFESAPGLFLVVMPDSPRFTVVAASEAFLSTTRKRREEILGKGLFEKISTGPETSCNLFANGEQDLQSSLMSATATRVPIRMTAQGDFVAHSSTSSSESEVIVYCSVIAPVSNDQGDVVNLICSFEHLSLPSQVEKNERLILESLTDLSICLLDTRGKIMSWNAGAETVQGYLASEVIGKSFSMFYSVEDVKSGKPIADLRLADIQGKFEEEVQRFRKDGTEFWASVSIAAIHDEKEVLNGFVKVVRDISRSRNDALALVQAREILEARVKERTQDLLRSNTDLEQFAYIASHDLQTPLRHISSYVQLLTKNIQKNHALDAKSEKWVQYILSGTQQMKSLISDLLSYSRIGRMDIRVEEVDTSKLIERVMDELRDTIRATNAKILYEAPPKIQGIKSQIEQLFQNLVENALKFKKLDVEPVVTIKCEDRGEFWVFSVIDNGIGLDSKYSERIFLMFHRLHSSDKYAGTGIGLAICKKIIEFHGGKIWVDSTEGEGASFSFTLPKEERVTSTALSKQSAPAPGIKPEVSRSL